MKRRNKLLLSACILALLAAAAIAVISTCKKDSADDFFFCTDGFYAVPQNASTQLSLTFYHKNSSDKMSKLSGLAFVGDGLADSVIVTQPSVIPIEAVAGYDRASVSFDVEFKKTGIYTASFMEMRFSDGSKAVYPIGTWTFDVGAESGDILYNTIVMTSNKDLFRYSLDTGRVGTMDKLTKIIYGAGLEYHDEDGLPLEGDFAFDAPTSLPVRIIRPKFIYERDGEEKIAYGTLVYLGVVKSDEGAYEKDLELVREYIDQALSQKE